MEETSVKFTPQDKAIIRHNLFGVPQVKEVCLSLQGILSMGCRVYSMAELIEDIPNMDCYYTAMLSNYSTAFTICIKHLDMAMEDDSNLSMEVPELRRSLDHYQKLALFTLEKAETAEEKYVAMVVITDALDSQLRVIERHGYGRTLARLPIQEGEKKE